MFEGQSQGRAAKINYAHVLTDTYGMADATSFQISFIRTATPLIVGLLATLLVHFGIKVDDASLLLIVQTLVSGGYYSTFRFLEQKFPWVGKFLGKATAPSYGPAIDAAEKVIENKVAEVVDSPTTQAALFADLTGALGSSNADGGVQ